MKYMNWNRTKSAQATRAAERGVYERLSRRIEKFAEREGRNSNAEKIRLMREAAFADVEAFVKSGQLKLPPPPWGGLRKPDPAESG
jgi:hypothetical protein